ncbi:MAG: hypothetical protein RIG63_27465 [Coleofasciculus chthonoplastes F3-SA18-01]|uniref:hypothetical protein n=1 Tax=Coleofasciculus chthonoplastes TaxID=64178 RepID=UPI0032F8592F
MLTQIRRLLNRFFRRSRTINDEPLNKVSLIVIILIDIFILVNVFTGLNNISQWHISPSSAYPCYSEWKNYQTQTISDKDYEIIQSSVRSAINYQSNFQQTYQQAAVGHLGTVSQTCLEYGSYKDKLNNPENQQIIAAIDQKQEQISQLEQTNRSIREQYDSTLLEKIAGQSRDQSINRVGAEQAKQQLEQNNRNIARLKQEIAQLKNQLTAKPESLVFINFLKNKRTFQSIENAYQRASFWYPSIQFSFQALFLLPLIFLSLSVYNFAQRKGYGLIALISWHLSVVFFVPLIFKLFEFLQFGAIVQFLVDIISTLLGGLVFLVSYAYILLIPLIGFGIIKFFQKIVFNPKVQAATRVQKSRCIRCAKKNMTHDAYCSHCGFYQYVECQNCHSMTYKYLPYCKQCGQSQDSN